MHAVVAMSLASPPAVLVKFSKLATGMGMTGKANFLNRLSPATFIFLDVEEAFVEHGLLRFGDVRIEREGPHFDCHVDTGQHVSRWPQSHEIEVCHYARPVRT